MMNKLKPCADEITEMFGAYNVNIYYWLYVLTIVHATNSHTIGQQNIGSRLCLGICSIYMYKSW